MKGHDVLTEGVVVEKDPFFEGEKEIRMSKTLIQLW